MEAAERFEYATAADPALNYCLWQYTPAAPAEDKFRAVNLLWHSFELAGLDARAYAIIEAIRDAIGPFRTVFGIKLLPQGLAWELYFYDYARQGRCVSATRVQEALAPWVASPVRVNENLPYFMFSIDLDAAIVAGERPLDVVHLYIGNPHSLVSSGIAYAARERSMTLENFYFFFDAATQQREVADKISCSAHYDTTTLPVERIVLPELKDCQTICVANKQGHDCVYFSGITVEQLLFFLDWLRYPAALTGFVREHRSRLDHLRFDVGFDYRVEDGQLRVLKSGYYGVC